MINMDSGVTRRGTLRVLSDGPLVCTGTLENVDLRSEKVCAYMRHTSGGCEQRPRSLRDAA